MRVLCLGILFFILFSAMAQGKVINEYVDKDASSSYYEYLDNNGKLNFTDSFDSIPHEYKKNAKLVTRTMRKGLPSIVTGTVPDLSSWSSTAETQIQEPVGDAEAAVKYTSGIKLMKVTGAMIVLLFFLLLVGKLGKSLEKHQLAIIIRIVLTLSVLLYVFIVYQRELVDRYMSIRQDVDNVQKVMEKRENKINEMTK